MHVERCALNVELARGEAAREVAVGAVGLVDGRAGVDARVERGGHASHHGREGRRGGEGGIDLYIVCVINIGKYQRWDTGSVD